VLEQLIAEYKETLKVVRYLQNEADEKDKKIIAGIISDLEYALEWMTTGRRPGLRRGIERRSAYQRERPFDPVLMQTYFRSLEATNYSWDNHHHEDGISTWDYERIEDALSILSDREKEIYLMSRGYCLPYSEIASLLGLKKATVQNNIKRAEKKISTHIQESLFCL
jgi:RNA polymerase sigma-70 factor (ECF subfamily)